MRKLFLYISFLITLPAFAQVEEHFDGPSDDSLMGIIDTSFVRKYPYIRWGLNRFEFYSDTSPAFERFYEKFDSLVNKKDRQLHIYHIGGSHIQADVYTHRVRTYLQEFGPGIQGPKGLLFPYTVAGTNNPWSYKSESTGEWRAYRNVVRKDTLPLGLLGIAISTKDSLSSIKIYTRKNEPMHYRFNKIRVYHNRNAVKTHSLSIRENIFIKNIVTDTITGYTDIFLNALLDTLNLNITRIVGDTSHFILYGIELWNDEPGIIYTTIGVNGAAFPNYLKCTEFENQLAEHKPDLFIISIGTNDGNVTYDDFKPELYKANYEAMIKTILRTNPNAAILLTVPNDAYYYKRYPNKNIAREREMIIELAKEYKMGVWDFYGVMGDLGSSQNWYKDNLMHKDRIHFTHTGYYLKGDLFYEAFLKYLDEFEFRRLMRLTDED
jgi:lysophospholipase L1-like esterase